MIKRKIEKIEERIGAESEPDEWSRINEELELLFITFLLRYATHDEIEHFRTFAGVVAGYITDEKSESAREELQEKLDERFISWLIKQGREDIAEYAAPCGFYGVKTKLDLSGFTSTELKRLIEIMTFEGDEEVGEA